MWLDLGNHLHLQRHIYMRVQNSVYNWIEASFTQSERWFLGSEKGYCFWNYFHRHLWNSKGQIIYYLYPAPAYLFIYLFNFFFSNFLISQKWRIFTGKTHLALKKHKFSNKQFAIAALPFLPGLPEYPSDIPGDLEQSCWCCVVVACA